jgi:hypothetical protein
MCVCRMETKELKAEVNQLGVLMGLYVYIWNRLIKERVPACYCDGMLCTTLDAILSSTTSTATDPFYIQGADAELLAKTAAVHCLLRDDIKEIRKVLEAKAKPRVELARAFKVGQGYEALKDQIRDTAAQRMWQGRSYELIPLETVQRLLVAHNCASLLRNFNAFVRDHHTQVACVLVEQTHAEAVLAGLFQCFEKPDAFYAQVAWPKHDIPFATVLVLSERNLRIYMQYASYGTLGSKSPYAYAPVICQLWASSDSRPQSIDLMRTLCGLPRSLSRPDADDIARIRQAWLSWNTQYTPAELAAVLPVLLNYDSLELPVHWSNRDAWALKEHKTMAVPDKLAANNWRWMMSCAGNIIVPSLRLTFLLCFAKNQKVPEVVKESTKQMKDLVKRHPYSKWMLRTQNDRAIARPQQQKHQHEEECNSEQLSKLWQTLAIVEQQLIQRASYILSPVEELGTGGPFNGGHMCLRMYDFPIARNDSETVQEEYCGRVFPVFALAQQVEIPDRFRFVRTLFRERVLPSMHQNTANFPPTPGIQWVSRIEEMLADLTAVVPMESEETQRQQPVQEETKRPVSPPRDPRVRPAAEDPLPPHTGSTKRPAPAMPPEQQPPLKHPKKQHQKKAPPGRMKATLSLEYNFGSMSSTELIPD